MASTITLARMRLALDVHGSDLLLVGDRFEEGGRYVQMEVSRFETAEWGWLDWEAVYEKLGKAWHGRFDT